MKCNKTKQRSIFNLFEVLTCNNCINECIYNYIYIGNNTINIYELNNECINPIKKQNMIKLFLKECIVNEEDVFIILDNKEYIRYFDILPLLMNNSNLFVFLF